MEQHNEQHALATYVSDMLALERHIRIPFDAQQADDDFADVANADALVGRLVAASDDHIAQLKTCLEGLGGHEAAGIKETVSGIAGFVAGAIDKTRKTKVSKALRDDYTALALCAAGYTALIATANGMGDAAVSSTAEELLKDYAGLIMDVGRALPEAVAQELTELGLTVDASSAKASAEQVERAWRVQGDEQAKATAPRTIIGSVDGPLSDAAVEDQTQSAP